MRCELDDSRKNKALLYQQIAHEVTSPSSPMYGKLVVKHTVNKNTQKSVVQDP